MNARNSKRSGVVLLAAGAALTLVLATRTFWYLFRSLGNVPYLDLWPLLEEVQRRRSGQSGWSYLWSPYWGHRPVIPRLLIFLSARYLHYAALPFVLIGVGAQVAMLLVLIWLFRGLFRDREFVFWVSAIAATHLLLSSLQMEIFIEGLGMEYTIGYASAIAAIAIPGGSRLKVELRLWIAFALGLVSVTCLAIGLVVLPIIIFEGWLVRARTRHIAILSVLAGLVAVAYSIDFTRPQMGMGFDGVILRPLQALRITAMVLGGPVSLYSLWLGVVVGAMGMTIAFAVLVRFARDPALREKPGAIALALIVSFLIASAASIAVGRISPEWLALHSTQVLPSRYLAPTLAFWGTLFPAWLLCQRRGGVGRLVSLSAASIVLVLTLGTWNWQWRLPREWAVITESYDTTASGFLVGVSDPEYMDRIMADVALRDRMLAYMRRENLSVFAEPRARWLGRKAVSIAPGDHRGICRATINAAVLPEGASQALRVTGALTVDGHSPWRRLDVLLTDGTGTVQGLARTLPIYSESAPAADFFGYTRDVSVRDARIFVLSTDRLLACVVADRQSANGP